MSSVAQPTFTGRMSRRYKQWRSNICDFNVARRDAWVAALAAAVPAQSRVLDVGAGVGRYRPLFAHCEYRTHDFGQEPGTIGLYTQLDYVSDVSSIPVPDASFDVILCTEVLEHVPQPILAIREIGRILRPGGNLFLTAPLGSLLHQEPFHYYSGYTPYWYRKFLPEAGFRIDSIDANGGFFSLFGQEARRYRAYIDPRRTWRYGPAVWFGTTLLWLIVLPFAEVLPVVASALDKLEIEKIATVGYHVTATKEPQFVSRPPGS